VNYSELVVATASATNITKAEARKVLDAAVKVTSEALYKGESVTLGDIGKFVTKAKPARTARNPRTGAAVEVPAKTVVDFNVSKTFANAIALLD
jgi:DNA-binding protein HU-beta